jgi:Domain of unknown function (DUF4350)
MTRGWKIGIGIFVAVVAFDLLLRGLGSVTGGTPGGEDGSSYATARGGVAAYATLLGREHHRVDRSRDFPHSAKLDPADTVVVLEPEFVSKRDAQALRDFAAGGGRLVAAGNTDWLRHVVPDAPADTVLGPHVVRAQGLTLLTSGRAWRRPRSFVVTRRVGRGTVVALADTSPLENRLLDKRDNAAFGLQLAGQGRPVVFLETYHGYGRSSGLAALPLAWKLLLPGLALAALVYMLARGRRFGPPESRERDLPPPRREYVDSLAGVLARTPRAQALAPVRAHARAELLRRTREDSVEVAARRIGLDDAETQALLGGDDALALGRALARIGQDPR